MADAGALWGQARQQPVNYLRNQTIRLSATRAPMSCWPLITERLLSRQTRSDLDLDRGAASANAPPPLCVSYRHSIFSGICRPSDLHSFSSSGLSEREEMGTKVPTMMGWSTWAVRIGSTAEGPFVWLPQRIGTGL